MAPSECIFCAIVSGDAPATIIDEDERTISFMDIHPWTRGHALVIPREHHKNLYEISEDDLTHTMLAAKRLAAKVRDTLGADGVNLLNSTERAAWQTVFHFHVHVIPRYEGDPLEVPVQPEQADADQIKQVGEQLRG